MSYEKQNFQSGQVLTADQMNCIEDGVCEAIDSANRALDSAQEALDSTITQDQLDQAVEKSIDDRNLVEQVEVDIIIEESVTRYIDSIGAVTFGNFSSYFNPEVEAWSKSKGIDDHLAITEGNPHGVTCEQIGAATTEECNAALAEAQEAMALANITASEFLEHRDNTDNPHGMTCEQLGAATKEELQASIGDIETALDGIIAIQNQLIGGDGV